MDLIERSLGSTIERNLSKFPILSITGPRQSGKTTLAKMICPYYKYVNLENPSDRLFANEDPVGFLDTYQNGVIIDEIQYVPELFSYLQVRTDERRRMGEYIITGSQNFLMMEKITQSLAGRVAIFHLLPFSVSELETTLLASPEWQADILSGFYPGKRVRNIETALFYDSYIQTYVERDVRQVKNILNLDLFQRFIRLLAGRVGQIFNQSNLSVELGVDHKTIYAWMSVLETSFIAFRLPPYFENFSKRMIKAPKIYFYDVGLAAYLLGIRNMQQLQTHYALGNLFENHVIAEMMKLAWNDSKRPEFYFWRDTANHEIDLIIPEGNTIKAIEIKSGKRRV